MHVRRGIHGTLIAGSHAVLVAMKRSVHSTNRGETAVYDPIASGWSSSPRRRLGQAWLEEDCPQHSRVCNATWFPLR